MRVEGKTSIIPPKSFASSKIKIAKQFEKTVKLLATFDSFRAARGKKYCLSISPQTGIIHLEKLHFQVSFTKPPIFVSPNHGEDYGMWEFARIRRFIKDGATLLHFDAHHDLTSGYFSELRPKEEREAIRVSCQKADFILPALYHGLISRYIWILPLGVTEENLAAYLRVYSLTRDGKFPQEAYLGKTESLSYLRLADKKGKPLFSDLPDDLEEEIIKLFDPPKIFRPEVVTFAELDSLKLNKENFILDLDWFGDKAKDDLVADAGLKRKEAVFFLRDLHQATNLFLTKLKNLSFQPSVVTFALSPDHFWQHRQLEPLLKNLIGGMP